MLCDAEHQHIGMGTLSDEQDVWAPRGRDWTEPWWFLPCLTFPGPLGRRLSCLWNNSQNCCALSSCFCSWDGPAQAETTKTKRDGGAASGSHTRISPYNLLALPTVLVHTGAERHRGWRCTFFVPASWARWYILAVRRQIQCTHAGNQFRGSPMSAVTSVITWSLLGCLHSTVGRQVLAELLEWHCWLQGNLLPVLPARSLLAAHRTRQAEVACKAIAHTASGQLQALFPIYIHTQ